MTPNGPDTSDLDAMRAMTEKLPGQYGPDLEKLVELRRLKEAGEAAHKDFLALGEVIRKRIQADGVKSRYTRDGTRVTVSTRKIYTAPRAVRVALILEAAQEALLTVPDKEFSAYIESLVEGGHALPEGVTLVEVHQVSVHAPKQEK